MNGQTAVTMKNGPVLFVLERLTPDFRLDAFDCSIAEYNEYLTQEAQRIL